MKTITPCCKSLLFLLLSCSFFDAHAQPASGQTLPVRLLSFSGSRTNNNTQLQWSTTSEAVDATFEIERSIDNGKFYTIASIAADFFYNNYYRFKDTASGGIIYYRLKIIASDGTNTYSDIIAFKQNNVQVDDIQLLQNPVAGNISLRVSAMQKGKLYVYLTAVNGQKAMQQAMDVSPGISQLTIPIPAYCANGQYIMQAAMLHTKKTMQIILIR
jgi:hypothetical protein